MQLHVSSSDIECVYIIIKIIKNGDQKKNSKNGKTWNNSESVYNIQSCEDLLKL